ERSVVLGVLRQRDRHAERTHARHAVFHVPRLEVRVPVELLPEESRLVVETRLMDVDLVAEEVASDPGETLVGREAREQQALRVDREDRAQLLAVRLENQRVAIDPDRRLAQPIELGNERVDLCRTEQAIELEKAVAVVLPHLLARERALLARRRVHDGIDAIGDVRGVVNARYVRIVLLPSKNCRHSQASTASASSGYAPLSSCTSRPCSAGLNTHATVSSVSACRTCSSCLSRI